MPFIFLIFLTATLSLVDLVTRLLDFRNKLTKRILGGIATKLVITPTDIFKLDKIIRKQSKKK